MDSPRLTSAALALAAGVLAGAVLVAGALLAGAVPGSSGAADTTGPATAGREDVVPLGRPATPPAGEGGWVATARARDGRPVGWDPCRPVHYVVTPGAPPGAEPLLADAVAELARATGLRLVADGSTPERPSAQRPARQPARYGERWAPVLVAWSDPGEAPRLAGDVLGYAGATPAGASPAGDGTGVERYVTGQVVLDTPQLSGILAAEAGRARLRAVLLHELGHLAGLDHVEDPGQLMFRRATPLRTSYGDGDLRGLAAVSAGPCAGRG